MEAAIDADAMIPEPAVAELVSCRSCTQPVAKEDSAVLGPCNCCFCVPCLLDLLVLTRMQPSVACSSCGAFVASYQLQRAGAMLKPLGAGGESSMVAAAANNVPSVTDNNNSEAPIVPGDEALGLQPVPVAEDATPPQPQDGAASVPPASADNAAEGAKPAAATGESPQKPPAAKPPAPKIPLPPVRPFAEYLQMLEAYKEKHGDANVPYSYKGEDGADDPSLAQFVMAVGTGALKITIVERAQLTSLGFPWKNWQSAATVKKRKKIVRRKKVEKPPRKKRKTFNERVYDLKQYKANHGTIRVPFRYKGDANLGEWVKNIRIGRFQLSDEQRKELDDLGFVWEAKRDRMDREWNEKLEKVKAYKHRYGNTRIPQGWVFDKSLADWCHTQRKQKRKKTMRADRIAALDAIDFEWEPGQMNTAMNIAKKKKLLPGLPTDEEVVAGVAAAAQAAGPPPLGTATQLAPPTLNAATLTTALGATGLNAATLTTALGAAAAALPQPVQVQMAQQPQQQMQTQVQVPMQMQPQQQQPQQQLQDDGSLAALHRQQQQQQQQQNQQQAHRTLPFGYGVL